MTGDRPHVRGAWPTCRWCPDGTPARHTVAAGHTPTRADYQQSTCDRHLHHASAAARRWPYRETRPAAPGDGAVTPDVKQLDLFGGAG
jgi:hypothetical protein